MYALARAFDPEKSLLFCKTDTATARAATIRGKETLFIYRKTPGGGQFMRAKLVQSWLLALPFLAINMIVTALRFAQGFTMNIFVSTGKVLFIAAANSAMAIGLSLGN